MNKQTIKFDRVVGHPDYCPVELGLNIVARAEVLGHTFHGKLDNDFDEFLFRIQGTFPTKIL